MASDLDRPLYGFLVSQVDFILGEGKMIHEVHYIKIMLPRCTGSSPPHRFRVTLRIYTSVSISFLDALLDEGTVLPYNVLFPKEMLQRLNKLSL
jgi:hypothetical protein